jgi:alkylation response protein AidB-like acyl-CoA dehydrogenase
MSSSAVYELDEMQRQDILNRQRTIIANQIMPCAARHDATGEFPAENFAALGRAGLMGLFVPPRYGGLGIDYRLYSQLTRELSAACASTAMLSVMHHSQYATISFHGSEQQREFFLPAFARGEWFIANGATEALTGDTFYAPGTVPHSTLRADGSDYVLNSSKSIVSGASHANWILVVCRLDSDNTGRKRAVLAPGVGHPDVFPFGTWDPIGMRATASTGIEHRGCKIPHWHLFDANATLQHTMIPVGLIGFCSVWLGIAIAAYGQAIAHVTGRSIDMLRSDQRSGLGGETVRVQSTVARFDTVQRQVAELKARIDAATALVDSVAHLADRSRSDRTSPITPAAFESVLDLIHSARVYTSETAIDVCRIAMRICGARGLQRNLPLERLMRDALTAQVMGVTEDATKVTHGRRLLGIPNG